MTWTSPQRTVSRRASTRGRRRPSRDGSRRPTDGDGDAVHVPHRGAMRRSPRTRGWRPESRRRTSSPGGRRRAGTPPQASTRGGGGRELTFRWRAAQRRTVPSAHDAGLLWRDTPPGVTSDETVRRWAPTLGVTASPQAYELPRRSRPRSPSADGRFAGSSTTSRRVRSGRPPFRVPTRIANTWGLETSSRPGRYRAFPSVDAGSTTPCGSRLRPRRGRVIDVPWPTSAPIPGIGQAVARGEGARLERSVAEARGHDVTGTPAWWVDDPLIPVQGVTRSNADPPPPSPEGRRRRPVGSPRWLTPTQLLKISAQRWQFAFQAGCHRGRSRAVSELAGVLRRLPDQCSAAARFPLRRRRPRRGPSAGSCAHGRRLQPPPGGVWPRADPDGAAIGRGGPHRHQHEASLAVPTATASGSPGQAALCQPPDHERYPRTGGKVSFTHLIGTPGGRAVADESGDERQHVGPTASLGSSVTAPRPRPRCGRP
jgi:hypothetical protein